MATHPDSIEERARQAADQLRQASAVEPPHFRDVLSLARAGRVVTMVVAVAVTAFLAGAAFATSALVGPSVLVWGAAVVVFSLVVATAVVSAHAGGHAWFVPLPGAFLAIAFAMAVSGPNRSASAWWLLAASAAFSGMAVLMAAGVLRSRAVARSVPQPTLVGAQGTAVSAMEPMGIARVNGETWTAESVSGPLPAGATVHVVRVEGLRLLVWSEQGDVLGPSSLPKHAAG